MPRLDFFIGSKQFLRVGLGTISVTIGRGSECEVQLPDTRVSRNHARIILGPDGEYWIENLSPNGTRLNALMLAENTRLSPGDRVYIADYVMVYHPEDAPPLRDEFDATVVGESSPPTTGSA